MEQGIFSDLVDDDYDELVASSDRKLLVPVSFHVSDLLLLLLYFYSYYLHSIECK